MITRPWAFWRRVQYGSGFSVLLLLFLYWGYASFLYSAPTCTDGRQNGLERGVDCGGGCAKVCLIDVVTPQVNWARSFRVTDGQYNAVAYVENKNSQLGTPLIAYTFTLYDNEGMITERSGTTFLPPNSQYPIFEGRISTGSRVPTRTFLELQEADNWVPASTGREQFRIVSRELLSADTRPRLNAVIENTAFIQSNDIEIVATIFDARGNALTASQTYVDSVAARAEEQIVFTWPEPIAKTLRSCEVPTDVVVAIDLSGSMNNDRATPPEPITTVLSAAEQFTTRLGDRDQAALVTFASEGTVVTGFSPSSQVAATVRTLTIAPTEETGTTNTGEGLLRAAEVFASSAKNPNARKVLVILTDGLATAPDQDPDGYAREAATALKDTDVDIYAIGLGQQVNMDFVRSLASENKSYQALTRDRVNAIYEEITGAICEDGAAIIDIVPKTMSGFSGR